ncbi:ABC transporter permease [Radicibacter daui]|uniref:ABC transporter permease n=1 Tax=Radicibacter daui TaxID=3064829 RepID=UPI004046E2E9
MTDTVTGVTPERKAARRQAVRGLALAAPAALWTFAFFLLPTLAIALWSFFRQQGRELVTVPGLDNYRRFFEQSAFVKGLWNSLEVTLLVTVFSVLLAYPLAWVIATRIAPRFQRLVLMLAVLPFWTSYVVRSYAWLLVLAPNGVINQTLLSLGFISEPLKLSFNQGATVLGFVHFFTMLCTLTIYSSLSRLDPKLHLAAADLGAGAFAIFWRVTLPLTMPGIASGAFLTFVVAVGDYVTPQILGGNNQLVLPQLILMQVIRRADIPMASALSMILMLLVVAAYLAAARWLTRGRA